MKLLKNTLTKSFIALSLLGSFSPTILAATRLGNAMNLMADDLKALNKSLGDSTQNTKNLQLLNSLITETDKSRAEIPPKANKIPSADRARFITSYQDKLDELKIILLKAVDLIKAQKNAEAQALIQDIINIKKDGHSQYK